METFSKEDYIEETDKLIETLYNEMMNYTSPSDESKTKLWNFYAISEDISEVYPQELDDVFVPAKTGEEALIALEKYTKVNVDTEGFLRGILRDFFYDEIRIVVEAMSFNEPYEPLTGKDILYLIFEEGAISREIRVNSYSKVEPWFGPINPSLVDGNPEWTDIEEASQEKLKFYSFNTDYGEELSGVFFPAKTIEGALVKLNAFSNTAVTQHELTPDVLVENNALVYNSLKIIAPL